MVKLGQAKLTFELKGEKFVFPVRRSVSFFGFDINLINRLPNNFLPNQKNFTVESLKRIERVSSQLNHFTKSINDKNTTFLATYVTEKT